MNYRCVWIIPSAVCSKFLIVDPVEKRYFPFVLCLQCIITIIIMRRLLARGYVICDIHLWNNIYIHTFISNLWRFLYSSFRIQLKLFQTAVFTTSGKMIIPIRCFTCGKVMFVTSGWYSGLYSIGLKTSETYIFPPSKLHSSFLLAHDFVFILQFLYIFYGTL